MILIRLSYDIIKDHNGNTAFLVMIKEMSGTNLYPIVTRIIM